MSLSYKGLPALGHSQHWDPTFIGLKPIGSCGSKVCKQMFPMDERAQITRSVVVEGATTGGDNEIRMAQPAARKIVAPRAHSFSVGRLSELAPGDVDLALVGTDFTRIWFRKGGSRR